jgi:hypothetical protein
MKMTLTMATSMSVSNETWSRNSVWGCSAESYREDLAGKKALWGMKSNQTRDKAT